MKHRILSLDLSRILAILGVVAIHTENITASKTNYLGGLSWWFANTIHSLVVVSVPLFIMISGSLLLRKKEITKKYVLKKIWREFLPPLLFWWIFYFYWNSRPFVSIDLKSFFTKFFLTETGHLYFLQIIIGLYFLAPLIFRLIKNHIFSKKMLIFLTLIVMIYEYSSYLFLNTYNKSNLLIISIPFITYFVWGMHLSKVILNKKQWWFISFISMGVVFVISYLTFMSTKLFNSGNTLLWTPSGGNLFWEPFTLPVLLLSGMIFILLNNIEVVFPTIFKSEKSKSFLVLLSNISFGVYLIHPFVLDRLDTIFNLAVHLTKMPLWFYYLYRTGLVFIVSSVIVILVSKIKLFNALLGVRKNRCNT